VPTTRLAQAKASDFDFETKEEFARPSSQVDVRQKGGIVYRAKTSNADELAAAAKAIGGKVSGQFESAASGAWQMVGDLISATGDLTGSNAVDQFGARLSAGNAQQQKQAQARLAAIGDNPNAALNFVESPRLAKLWPTNTALVKLRASAAQRLWLEAQPWDRLNWLVS